MAGSFSHIFGTYIPRERAFPAVLHPATVSYGHGHAHGAHSGHHVLHHHTENAAVCHKAGGSFPHWYLYHIPLEHILSSSALPLISRHKAGSALHTDARCFQTSVTLRATAPFKRSLGCGSCFLSPLLKEGGRRSLTGVWPAVLRQYKDNRQNGVAKPQSLRDSSFQKEP